MQTGLNYSLQVKAYQQFSDGTRCENTTAQVPSLCNHNTGSTVIETRLHALNTPPVRTRQLWPLVLVDSLLHS